MEFPSMPVSCLAGLWFRTGRGGGSPPRLPGPSRPHPPRLRPPPGRRNGLGAPRAAEGDSLQGLGRRGYLGEDIDAVLVLVDHPLQAADLALDAAQALEVDVLVVGITVHVFFPIRPG